MSITDEIYSLLRQIVPCAEFNVQRSHPQLSIDPSVISILKKQTDFVHFELYLVFNLPIVHDLWVDVCFNCRENCPTDVPPHIENVLTKFHWMVRGFEDHEFFKSYMVDHEVPTERTIVLPDGCSPRKAFTLIEPLIRGWYLLLSEITFCLLAEETTRSVEQSIELAEARRKRMIGIS